MDNYNLYKIATENADWKRICEINGVNFEAFGTRKELAVLKSYLEPDEIVFALASGLMKQTATSNAFDWGVNTWLAVLTSDRFLFLDAAMLTSSVDTQSIRLKNVQAISASQGFVFGKIMIDLGSRIVMVDNCPKDAVKVMAELGNRWIKELENGFVPPKENSDMTEFKNKLNAENNRVMPPIADAPTVNKTSAALVTTLFGWFGLNDYIYGDSKHGMVKSPLAGFMMITFQHDSYVISSLLMFILTIWVFVDLVRVFDGSFFGDKKSSEISNGLEAILGLVYLLAIIGNGYGFVMDCVDSRKKDNKKLASVREIVDTYNQNEAAAKKAFDGPRFTIAGSVQSVEEGFFGYTLKFEGMGINIFNLGSKITDMELSFPKSQSKELLNIRKGDIVAANCVGRGVTFNVYSADKCFVKALRKKK